MFADSSRQHVDGNGADVERCSKRRRSPTVCASRTTAFRGRTRSRRRSATSSSFSTRTTIRSLARRAAGNTCAPVPYGTHRPHQHRRRHGRRLAAGDQRRASCSATTTVSSSAAASTTAGPASPRRAHARLHQSRPRRSPSIRRSRATAQIIHTLGNVDSSRSISMRENTYFGLYATDTFDITSQLSRDGRRAANVAKLKMADLTGVVARPQQRPDLYAAQSAGRLDLQGRARAHSSMAAIRNRTARRRRSSSAAPIRTGPA